MKIMLNRINLKANEYYLVNTPKILSHSRKITVQSISIFIVNPPKTELNQRTTLGLNPSTKD